MDIYSQAVEFAQRGWQVLPLHTIDPSDGHCSCGNADCTSPGKHPLTQNGVKDATTDLTQIERWWQETDGLANVGIATGNGLLAVDADAGKGGLESLAQWEKKYGPLPLTPTVGTGGGGKHLYFVLPEGVSLCNRTGIAPGIDIRGDNGYVVAPPSLHKSGCRYRWLTPPKTPVSIAPDWLLGLLAESSAETEAESKTPCGLNVGHDLSTHPGIGEGQRNATLCKLIGVHLARGESPDRIEPLAVAWAERCSPAYPKGETLRVVREISAKHQRKEQVGESEAIDAFPLASPPPWPELHPDALHGLAGEFVRLVEPETEADKVGILLSLLACIGNNIGRSVWFPVEGDRHYCNLFITLVGESSRARKGTSLGRTLGLFDELDPWRKDRISSGLSSGEGLKYHVRDAVEATERVKQGGAIVYQQVIKDPGVSDKRLLAIEPELAQALKQMQREGNTLSPVLRQAWDSGNLKTLTKNDPVIATNAHISLLGHITSDELGKMLSDCDTSNGFANRFCWALVRRSKLLPDGGRELDLSVLRERLKTAIAGAGGQMSRSPEAQQLWHELYPILTAERPGRFGMATSRAEAQTLRLSMIYALLGGTTLIDAVHLRAAYAVWRYCEASARQIFGEGEALPPLEQKLLQSIRREPGVNRKGLHKAMGNNIAAETLVQALGVLLAKRLAYRTQESGRGRPAERWWPGQSPEAPQPPPTNERTMPPEQQAPSEPISSSVRATTTESNGQSQQHGSLVRCPVDTQAEAAVLDLADLFAQVSGMGGKIVRKGEGFGVEVGGEVLLLSPTLKRSLAAHADALALLFPGATADARSQRYEPPAAVIAEMQDEFRPNNVEAERRERMGLNEPEMDAEEFHRLLDEALSPIG